MASRLNLQAMLEELLGSRNVYFQPPASVKMSYPAIVYSLNGFDKKLADDQCYMLQRSYQITYIDKSPDSPLVDKIASLPLCSFVQHFTMDNLNHYNYTIYY